MVVLQYITASFLQIPDLGGCAKTTSNVPPGTSSPVGPGRLPIARAAWVLGHSETDCLMRVKTLRGQMSGCQLSISAADLLGNTILG